MTIILVGIYSFGWGFSFGIVSSLDRKNDSISKHLLYSFVFGGVWPLILIGVLLEILVMKFRGNKNG